MRTIIYSHVFLPKYGGSGAVARLLANALSERGDDICIFTDTLEDWLGVLDYPIRRGFSFSNFMHSAIHADLVILLGPSLRALGAARLVNRNVIVVHPMMASRTFKGQLAALATRLAVNVAPSNAVRDSFRINMNVLGNPYDDDIYWKPERDTPRQDLVFVGRLIRQKGLHVMIEALGHLMTYRECPTLTVIGDGPDLAFNEELAAGLGVQRQVRFLGRLDHKAIAAELQSHRFIVVPSLDGEAFGLVALEGLACGCVPVVSDSGGLPDAVGPCGVTFRSGDPADLARALLDVMRSSHPFEVFCREAETHLARHRKRAFASRLLSVLPPRESSTRRTRRRPISPPIADGETFAAGRKE